MHYDARLHVRGSSLFVDDLPEPPRLLHAAVVTSPVARGELREVDASRALAMPGVAAVLTADDIPGENQIGTIIMDEELLATRELSYAGEPVALVLASSRRLSRRAAAAVRLEVQEERPVLEPREAFRLGLTVAPSTTLAIGDVERAFGESRTVIEGRADSGGQEHLYLETQAAMTVPGEDGRLLVHSSTQGPSYVQRVTARVLGESMTSVEVDVGRLGGAFGGKEDQATPWAVMTALGARLTGRPVKLVLERCEDMAWTGKRHPYTSDYRMGLDAEGRVIAWEVTYYQDSGSASDLSTAIMERTLFHATASYHVPNVRVTGHCCRTNRPPNTAFRGFGGPQAMFVMECALADAAGRLGVPVRELQERNLLSTGDLLPYGMAYEGDEVRRSWEELCRLYPPEEEAERVRALNAADPVVKRGTALMPVCFGISFTNTSMNQASALVHVYLDGSVGVSTGAVEMGQGVGSKLRLVAARTLGLDPSLVAVETTNTTRAANASPTAASTGSDMNGNAVRMACHAILERLRARAADLLGLPAEGSEAIVIREGAVLLDGEPTDLGWVELVAEAWKSRVSLSAQAHYATPGIHFDRETGRGRPFAYHVAGTAMVTVALDRLRGTCRVESVRVVHDCGESIDETIDRGQIEGGLVQGIGWMTMEELRCDGDGRLLSDSMATYKVPDILSVPEVTVHLLAGSGGGSGVYGSKAVGEPPFMYGIGAYTALLDALRAAGRKEASEHVSPMSAERLLSLLTGEVGEGP